MVSFKNVRVMRVKLGNVGEGRCRALVTHGGSSSKGDTRHGDVS